ncbi:MAG: hypothetical protein CL676_12850 [Bdellovibrionaceae bacterium]|nr:hypothetical protein [Pseudobdellovibrionaceae bacterium]|tara:strand:+ start:2351 stop:2653 length:303 start_codon:yes stop_codon:yes gene_type:complete
MKSPLSQEKRVSYAAGTHGFVQSSGNFKAFRTFLSKKFDRKKTSGLAFELDDELSFLKDSSVSMFSTDKSILQFAALILPARKRITEILIESDRRVFQRL